MSNSLDAIGKKKKKKKGWLRANSAGFYSSNSDMVSVVLPAAPPVTPIKKTGFIFPFICG